MSGVSTHRYRPAARLLLAAALSAALMAGACSTEDTATPSPLRSGERPATASPPTTTAPTAVPTEFPESWVPPQLDWAPCDDLAPGLECATLPVPLDWSEPAGPTVDLALARFEASGDRIGSLLSNPGGPGGSGIDFLASQPFSATLSSRFDLVSWDPRGVGASTAVDCDDQVDTFLREDSDPDDADEQDTLDGAAEQVSDDCAEAEGALLANVSTAAVALDLEAIRRSLGDEPLNYLGFSYGTQIGQAYADRFPTEIRAMVLDGVVDPTLGYTDFLVAQAEAFEAAFDANAEACADAGPEACGVDDLGATFDRVKAMAEESPIPAGSTTLGPSEVVVGATFVQYLEDGWQALGPALADAEAGDGTALLDLANNYYDFGGFTSYAAVVCTDAAPPADPAAYREFADRARAAAPRFGGSVANELLPCATWPAEARPDAPPGSAEGAPPILVVGNTGDPATPYTGAVAVADRLASGVLLTVDIDGHTAYGANRCATRAIDRYLVDLVVPAEGTVCS